MVNVINLEKENTSLRDKQKSLIEAQTELSADIQNLKNLETEALEYKNNVELKQKLELQKEKIDENRKIIEKATEAQKLDKFYTFDAKLSEQYRPMHIGLSFMRVLNY